MSNMTTGKKMPVTDRSPLPRAIHRNSQFTADQNKSALPKNEVTKSPQPTPNIMDRRLEKPASERTMNVVSRMERTGLDKTDDPTQDEVEAVANRIAAEIAETENKGGISKDNSVKASTPYTIPGDSESMKKTSQKEITESVKSG